MRPWLNDNSADNNDDAVTDSQINNANVSQESSQAANDMSEILSCRARIPAKRLIKEIN